MYFVYASSEGFDESRACFDPDNYIRRGGRGPGLFFKSSAYFREGRTSISREI